MNSRGSGIWIAFEMTRCAHDTEKTLVIISQFEHCPLFLVSNNVLWKWGWKGFLVGARLHSTQFITLHSLWAQKHAFILNIQDWREEFPFRVRMWGVRAMDFWGSMSPDWSFQVRAFTGGRDRLHARCFKMEDKITAHISTLKAHRWRYSKVTPESTSAARDEIYTLVQTGAAD